MFEATRKTYGPFSLIDFPAPVDRPFLPLPWTEVRGCNLLVAVVDNVNDAIFSENQARVEYLVGAEIAVYGRIQGYPSLIKRQFVTGKTGPLCLEFEDEEGFDEVVFHARFFAGGISGAPTSGGVSAAVPFTAANGGIMTATVYIVPRTGFAKVR